VLERRTLVMAIGISARNVEVVQHSGAVDEVFRDADGVWEITQEYGHDMTPSVLAEVQV
jgi:hypothetical protein